MEEPKTPTQWNQCCSYPPWSSWKLCSHQDKKRSTYMCVLCVNNRQSTKWFAMNIWLPEHHLKFDLGSHRRFELKLSHQRSEHARKVTLSHPPHSFMCLYTTLLHSCLMIRYYVIDKRCGFVLNLFFSVSFPPSMASKPARSHLVISFHKPLHMVTSFFQFCHEWTRVGVSSQLNWHSLRWPNEADVLIGLNWALYNWIMK